MLNIIQSSSFKWSVAVSVIVIIAYIFTWHQYAMERFILVLVDLLIIVLYAIIFVGSIVFTIRKRKVYKQSFIPLCINSAALIIILCSPSPYHNKAHHIGTYSLSNQKNCNCKPGLYLEYYCVMGGGATDTDLNAIYLTDLKNFRLYTGVYDEADDHINVQCQKDSLFIEKTNDADYTGEGRKLRVIEKKSYNLQTLKERESFD